MKADLAIIIGLLLLIIILIAIPLVYEHNMRKEAAAQQLIVEQERKHEEEYKEAALRGAHLFIQMTKGSNKTIRAEAIKDAAWKQFLEEKKK